MEIMVATADGLEMHINILKIIQYYLNLHILTQILFEIAVCRRINQNIK